jgi:hypothetical protein
VSDPDIADLQVDGAHAILTSKAKGHVALRSGDGVQAEIDLVDPRQSRAGLQPMPNGLYSRSIDENLCPYSGRPGRGAALHPTPIQRPRMIQLISMRITAPAVRICAPSAKTIASVAMARRRNRSGPAFDLR